jgi:hypothetical protein
VTYPAEKDAIPSTHAESRLYLQLSSFQDFAGGWATSDLKSIARVCLLKLNEITGGAPLLMLLEKWLAELLAL